MDGQISILKLEHGSDLPIPAYKTKLAAGFDLYAAIDRDNPVALAPGGRVLVPTGIKMALPQGYEGQIRPRSGMALEYGVSVLNSPGTIDADYRGEIKVLLFNFGERIACIERGMRVAQMVIAPVKQLTLTEVRVLDETGRGEGGFGSTGR